VGNPGNHRAVLEKGRKAPGRTLLLLRVHPGVLKVAFRENSPAFQKTPHFFSRRALKGPERKIKFSHKTVCHLWRKSLLFNTITGRKSDFLPEEEKKKDPVQKKGPQPMTLPSIRGKSGGPVISLEN